MSNIFNLLVQARNEQFNKVNPIGAGKSDIKPGQIVIAKLLPKPVGVNGEVMECMANWKPSNNGVFYKGQRFKMIVDVLYNKCSRGNNDIPVNELPGQLLYVWNPAITHEIVNQKTVERYNLRWMVLGKKPEVITPETAANYVLFANVKTLGQASDNVTKSCEDSLLAAYEKEANSGDDMAQSNWFTEDYLYDNLYDCHDAQIDSEINFAEANMNAVTDNTGDNNIQNGAADCHDAAL